MHGVLFKPNEGTPEHLTMKADWSEGLDPRMRGVLLELGEYVLRTFNKAVVITCLNRSQEENNRVGGSQWSAHLVGRAADIRSRNFSPLQVQTIEKHLSQVWGDALLYIKTHDSGHGPHIHINIRYAENRGWYGRPKQEV